MKTGKAGDGVTATRLRNMMTGLCVCVMLVTAGCGGGGTGDGNGAPPEGYLPLALGNSWQYLMTLAPDLEPVVAAEQDQNQEFDYSETVIGTGVSDGVEHFVVQSRREATDRWPEFEFFQLRRVDDTAVYARLPIFDEQGQFLRYYDAPYLKLPPQVGERWVDPEYGEEFVTAAVGEQVSVPAGTFSCVRVEQTAEIPAEDDGSPVQYVVRTWYARGVGVVRDETWEDDVKTSMIELVEYSVR